MVPTVEWRDGSLRMIDQTRLPLELVYRDYTDYRDVIRAIRTLVVRGAPAIGVAGAGAVALAARAVRAEDGVSLVEALRPACREIAAARPTAVNLSWAVRRMQAVAESVAGEGAEAVREALSAEVEAMIREDVETNRAMGRFGAELIPDGVSVLTHCNAGSLATAGYGTALGVIYAAREAGKRVRVFADETRPVLQGARLTAWELLQEGIDVTLITDSMAGHLMRRGEIQAVIVGADRIAANGDVANKIGTYTAAVLARAHDLPFYVAAPLSTVDPAAPDGDAIPIEERDPSEVTDVLGKVRIAPPGVRAANPAFDVTPASLVTAVVTEKGAFRPADVRRLFEAGADPDSFRIRPPAP